ncbi:MAG: 3'-5' exonuclease, partial [Candidatus Fermentibacteria bacterium]
MKYIIADTETTGLDAPIGVCEVAWIEIDENLETVSEFDSLLNPGCEIPCGAAGVHGIRTEDVQDSPAIEDITFPEGEVCLIAHNVAYDRPLIEP